MRLCNVPLQSTLKMGKKWGRFWVQYILWSSKILFLLLNRALIFFQMAISATLFRRCPTLPQSTLKMTTYFDVVQRCSIQRCIMQRCFIVVQRRKFKRSCIQRYFNVDLTLCNGATTYQPKNNVEPTLKCLLKKMLIET